MIVTMPDQTTLRILTTPQDTAFNGRTVASGRILEWIDRAGYACAVGWAKSYCVTAYVGNVRFARPIVPGQLVELDARIIQTGTTSMQVLVTVFAADIHGGGRTHAMDCLLAFVAVDGDRRPRAVPRWHPTDAVDRTMQTRAQERLGVRRAIRDAMLAESYSERGTTPRSAFRFLAAPSDANWGGNAHGGTVMRWIHEAAFSVAARWSTPSASATYSGGIHFLRPIRIGAVVEIEARLIHTTGHEMHIATRVSSAPVAEPLRRELTTVCMSIFRDSVGEVADSPRMVEMLKLQSDEDVRLDAHARLLVDLRRSLPPLPLLSDGCETFVDEVRDEDTVVESAHRR